MAFPTTPVLDDFVRADENPLSDGGNWDEPLRTASGSISGLRLVSNAAVPPTGGTGESYWTPATFTETEVYTTVSTFAGDNADFIGLVGRVQSPGTTGTVDFYSMEPLRVGAGNYSFDLYRVINGVFTSIGPFATGVAPSDGDKLGLEITGTGATVTLRGYKTTGGVWGQVGSDVSDTNAARIVAAGFIGMYMGAGAGQDWRAIDFGGGEVATPAGMAWVRSL